MSEQNTTDGPYIPDEKKYDYIDENGHAIKNVPVLGPAGVGMQTKKVNMTVLFRNPAGKKPEEMEGDK